VVKAQIHAGGRGKGGDVSAAHAGARATSGTSDRRARGILVGRVRRESALCWFAREV
jgi:succinyl-CoA synthetase beta subunit